MARTGILFVVSGPSGSGKTTLCKRFSEEDILASYAVSATTRPPREGETDGEDYFFMPREDFEERIANGEFLEHAEVHGNFYGTLKNEVVNRLKSGRDVLIDIDVQGAAQIRSQDEELIGRALADVFILPPGGDELVDRLRGRGTESEEQLALRLKNARAEMEQWREYQFTILSASKEEDYATFCAIIQSERCRTSRLKPGD